MEPQTNFLVRLLHAVPHINITLHQVNNTFNPESSIYVESIGILASIPATCLILSLIGLLLYFLTRCCDRKPRKSRSQTCQKCTLITTTLFCCAAIGLGLYGNDDFHNSLLQAFNSGKQIKELVFNFTNKTDKLKHDVRTNLLMSELEDTFGSPIGNETALLILLDHLRQLKENATRAVSALETVLYLIRPYEHDDSMKSILQVGELYESFRWPITLVFLTVLLLLCAILLIGVARNSRCSLIFFSVLGLFAVIICWLLSSIYLASSVAISDFCMRPNEFICRQILMKRPDDVNFLNCGTLRTRFIIRLNESRDHIERARDIFQKVLRMSRDMYSPIEIGKNIGQIERELEVTKQSLLTLTTMLDRRSIEKRYNAALKSLCGGGLFGLTLMMLASILSAVLFTILVCVDSHTWIYLSKRRMSLYINKSETTPFLSTTLASPTVPIVSGTSTINRTLLHHKQQNQSTCSLSVTGSSGANGSLNVPVTNNINFETLKNGSSSIGLAYSGDSPPLDYNIVVHDSRLSSASGHHTLGRLTPHQQTLHQNHHQNIHTSGPNNGKYATLSKQCKTLEANDFY